MGKFKLFHGLRTYIFGDRDFEVAGLDDLQTVSDSVSANTSRQTASVIPTAVDGSVNSVTIAALKGQYVEFVVRSGVGIYKVAGTASEANKTCTFDTLTGKLTFELGFYDGEFVWAQYKNVSSTEFTSSVITVDTYDQMLAAATGSRILEIFVNQASAYNDPGEFFRYVPTKGIAYLGIDFNYTQ